MADPATLAGITAVGSLAGGGAGIAGALGQQKPGAQTISPGQTPQGSPPPPALDQLLGGYRAPASNLGQSVQVQPLSVPSIQPGQNLLQLVQSFSKGGR